ncbi:FAD-binding monooxygenase, partial [Paenibacillus sepulcri]|nr:FAD-binding monooxygenase [Paenibacillus sepulcri]
LRGPHWTLLAFTDSSESPLPGIESEELHVHRIAGTDMKAANVFVDRRGDAYRAYAPEGNELVLIRPDGYIAVRCKSEDAALITNYLALVIPGA